MSKGMLTGGGFSGTGEFKGSGISVQLNKAQWDAMFKLLEKEAPEIAQKAFGTAIRKGTARIKDAVMALVPVDEGRLKNSISVRSTAKYNPYFWKSQIYSKRGRDRNDPKGAFYAHMVEYGTKSQSPNPFMRTGLKRVENEVRAYFIGDVKAALAKIKAKMK